jgi:hypothetical protein
MKILRGTIFGGVFYFFLGWLVYGILLMDYFSGCTNQCANKPDGEMVWWAIIASNLCAALFLTLILHWSKARGIVDGLVKGAIFGALFTLTIDLSFWSMTTMYSSLVTIHGRDDCKYSRFRTVGAVIVLTWGKE